MILIDSLNWRLGFALVVTWILFIVGFIAQGINHRGDSIHSMLPETMAQDKELELDLSKTKPQDPIYLSAGSEDFLANVDYVRQSPSVHNNQPQQAYVDPHPEQVYADSQHQQYPALC